MSRASRPPPVALVPRRSSRGIPVTTAEDTFLDLVPRLGLVDLVILGDSLVLRGRTSPRALRAAADASRGRHRRHAIRAAALVREHVDSPMESRLRLLLVLAGLPEPVVNHCDYDDTGRLLRRYDLSFPQQRLAIEFDGRQHAESSRQWERDVERREELDDEGWRIVVVLGKGIYREPRRTLERVVRRHERTRYPGSGDVRRVAAALPRRTRGRVTIGRPGGAYTPASRTPLMGAQSASPGTFVAVPAGDGRAGAGLTR